MPVFYSADNASNGNLLLVAILLFVQWGIGHATLGNQEWNTGILLLVWHAERTARIELGGGWGRRED